MATRKKKHPVPPSNREGVAKRKACKKCKGTGFFQLTKGIRYHGHLLIGGVSIRCDHKEQ